MGNFKSLFNKLLGFLPGRCACGTLDVRELRSLCIHM